MKTIEQLKAEVYDLLAQSQYIQGRINELNKEIANYPKEPVVKESLTGEANI